MNFIFSIHVKAQTLKITTWNIEWLLSSPADTHFSLPEDINFRQEQDFQRLAYYVRKLNADVIAFQEVGSVATAQKLFDPADYNLQIVHDPIPQHVGIAIRKGIFFQRNQDFLSLNVQKDSAFHPLRSGLDITLHGKTKTVRILVIHLKSGCADYPLTKHTHSCNLLNEQLTVLKQWISDRQKENQPFIILGDFNRILSFQDPFFKSLSKISPLIMPTAGTANPCWGGNYFIDGFLLGGESQNWFTPQSLRVMIYQENHLQEQSVLSDHCPVSIGLYLPE